MKYDVVFWAFDNISAERFIPVIVELNENGIKALLFYQHYNYRRELSLFNQALINTYRIEVLDYSHYMKNNVFLKITDFLSTLHCQNENLSGIHNKVRGLSARLIRSNMSARLSENIINDLSPGISFFYNVHLRGPREYPYGSYYLRETMKERNIPCYSMLGGVTRRLSSGFRKSTLTDYDKYFVPNENDMEKCKRKRHDDTVGIFVYGDSRFDLLWRTKLKNVFSKYFKETASFREPNNIFRIIYLMPNLECVGMGNLKYRNLEDVMNAVKNLKNSVLLIKPHPRYRDENKIREIAFKNGLNNYRVLEDVPLVCYSDYADMVISSFTSALFDMLPDKGHKVVIYDQFFNMDNVINIHENNFRFIKTSQELKVFLANIESDEAGLRKSLFSGQDGSYEFFRKWVSGGKDPTMIISSIAEEIIRGLRGKVRR